MTRKMKGPTQRTPAQSRGSTERQSAAVSARDECMEQLRRIAEDAQNFKIRLFHTPEDSAVREWTIFAQQKSEWMRKSADSIRTYVGEIRETFLDRGAMVKEVNMNWPPFKIHLDTLFATIREIYERAGEGASSRDDKKKRWDSRSVERAIEIHMAKCELEISRAITGPFKSFDAWIAERNRRAQARTVPPRPSKLPRKKTNLSVYADQIEAANLTELQREIFSLHLEHGLSFREIGKRLRKDPSTIREHFDAAARKIGGLKIGPKQRG